MNRKCAVKHAQHPTGPSRLRLRPDAFTLIEMLTVIAIIGVLAALLLPAIRLAQKKARIALAKSNISTLAQALTTYNMDFGAFPPDTNDGLSDAGVDFSDMDSPNECMVWFLTRDFSTNAMSAAGAPWASGSGWTPSSSPTVYSRISHRGSLDVREKQLRDDDGDGFYEFVDGWGRPYFYRAYEQRWDIDDITDRGSGVFRIEYSQNELENIAHKIGRVRITDCTDSGNNGTFDIVEAGDFWFEIDNSSGAAEAATGGEMRFKLQNEQTFDLYSLGPNGRTRCAGQPGDQPWNAQVEPDRWREAWGTPGDGNDVPSDQHGNIMTSDSDQDDINNWSN